MQKLIAVAVCVCMCLCSGVVQSPQSAGMDTQMQQFIAPQECVEESVSDGVSKRVILTPEECDELLHPKPPDPPVIPDDGDKTPPVDSDGNKVNAPNTGWMRTVSDAVYESGIAPIVMAILAVWLLRKMRKSK